MNYPPTLTDFKGFFDRDFKFGTGLDTVRDSDVNRVLNEAPALFNADLFDTSSATTADGPIAFLYLSAHLLALNIQAAGGLTPVQSGHGVDSHGGGPVSAKSVGAVSVTLALPPSITESPILSQFMRTDYGQKYLQLLTPRLVGNIYIVSGLDETGSQVDI